MPFQLTETQRRAIAMPESATKRTIKALTKKGYCNIAHIQLLTVANKRHWKVEWLNGNSKLVDCLGLSLKIREATLHKAPRSFWGGYIEAQTVSFQKHKMLEFKNPVTEEEVPVPPLSYKSLDYNAFDDNWEIDGVKIDEPVTIPKLNIVTIYDECYCNYLTLDQLIEHQKMALQYCREAGFGDFEALESQLAYFITLSSDTDWVTAMSEWRHRFQPVVSPYKRWRDMAEV